MGKTYIKPEVRTQVIELGVFGNYCPVDPPGGGHLNPSRFGGGGGYPLDMA